MNKENVLALAQHIENVDEKEFDMGRVQHSCGTPSCILGYAYHLQLELGLSIESSSTLFYPNSKMLNCSYHYAARKGERGYINKAHAVRCLRHLAETGEVDWDATAVEAA